jgi:tagatose 6-phosphate kinase
MIASMNVTASMSEKRILCIAVTPCLQRTLRCNRLRVGEVNRVCAAAVTTGGKSVNAARVIKALGGEPVVAGIAGGDTGSQLLALLDRMGIEHDFVRAAAATRVCTTIIEDEGGAVTELAEEASIPTDSDLGDLHGRVERLLPRCDIVIIAGALPPGCLGDVYADVARAAASRGVPVIIDTHGKPLLGTLAHAPLLAKLNRQELSRTRGLDVAQGRGLIDAARGLLGLGARWVLVTDAGRPALLVGEAGIWRFTPPSVKVLNNVGCGDAATAGIAVGLCRGENIHEAVSLGMACGAANAVTLTPDEVDRATVQCLLAGVTCSKQQIRIPR